MKKISQTEIILKIKCDKLRTSNEMLRNNKLMADKKMSAEILVED
jgi:hypothetical protein